MILDSRFEALRKIAKGATFDPAKFRLRDGYIVDCALGEYWYFSVEDGDFGHPFKVTMQPGAAKPEETFFSHHWDKAAKGQHHVFHPIYELFLHWLENIKREMAATTDPGETSAPDWVDTALPKEAHVIRKQARQLFHLLSVYEQMASLTWQSGDPLTERVREVFDAVGLTATSTTKHEPYDILVSWPDGRQLFVEVTGIQGHIDQNSNKVSQAAALTANFITDEKKDRILIAVNAFKQLPPAERAGKAVTTPQAETIFKAHDAVVVTTSSLYDVWLLSLTDKPAAKAAVEQIFTLPGGSIASLLQATR